MKNNIQKAHAAIQRIIEWEKPLINARSVISFTSPKPKPPQT